MGNYSSGRLLSLDGGGIRGVIEARVLEYIENKSNRKIKDSFEWISGTSTGALIALYLGLNHTASECIDLYKTLKDEIFRAQAYKDIVKISRSARSLDAKGVDTFAKAVDKNTKNIEKVLKDYFGETTKMSDIKNVKIIITVTLGKQDPLELIHYTNFDDKTKDELVWKVARATTAAPGYFKKFMLDEMGPVFDGGLTANNPTLTALSLIVNSKQNSIKEKLNLCLSLGTGLMPIMETELPDLPTGAIDAFWKWRSGELETLIRMFANELARTNGYVIEQAMAFCSVGNIRYYRLNPPISKFIDLDETDDQNIDLLIDETDIYLKDNDNLIQEII